MRGFEPMKGQNEDRLGAGYPAEGYQRSVGRVLLMGSLVLLPLSVSGQEDPIRGRASQEDPVLLDTLQVQVGSRASPGLPRLTRSISLLTRDDIQRLPVRDLAGLLEWTQGIEVEKRSPAQSDLSIRGSGFEQVVVLVNGVRMSDPQTGHFDLDLAVPLDQVERVEVLRGPASALYGADAMGGVVNIVTREGEGEWLGRVEGGSWGTSRLSLRKGMEWGEGSAVTAGGELSRSDGHRPGTDFDQALLFLGTTNPMGSGSLSADLGLARRNFGAQDFYAPYPSFEETRTYTSFLRWSQPFTESTELRVGGSFRRHEDEFTLIRNDPAAYQNRHSSYQMGGDVLLKMTGLEGIDLSAGGEFYQDRLRSNSLGDRQEGRGAIFGEAVLGGPGPGVLSLGLRQDVHQEYGSVFSPSLSASRRLGSNLGTRASVGKSFRAPTWTERYYQDPVNRGREDLDPEKAWSAEVGVDAWVSSTLRLSMTGFVRWAEDLIDWARPTDTGNEIPWETRNVEEATFRGLEAELSILDPLAVQWSLAASVLGVESDEEPGFFSKYALRPLEEQIRLGARRSFGGSLNLAVNVLRARRKGSDPYHRLDVRGRVGFGPLSLYLDAQNLLDAHYPDVTGATAPGRAVFVGLELGSGGASGS